MEERGRVEELVMTKSQEATDCIKPDAQREDEKMESQASIRPSTM